VGRAAGSLAATSSPSCAATPCARWRALTCAAPKQRGLAARVDRHPQAAKSDLLPNDSRASPGLPMLAALLNGPSPLLVEDGCLPRTSPSPLLT